MSDNFEPSSDIVTPSKAAVFANTFVNSAIEDRVGELAQGAKQTGLLQLTHFEPGSDSSSSSKAADFARAYIHSAIENPVNGLLQAVNQTSLVHLQPLELVDAAKPSAATAAGSLAGTVSIFMLASSAGNKLMGKLGGNGLAGSILRGGITGAVFEGLLQPSKEGSNSFWQDRIKNGLVGATTFASMAAAAGSLDRTGLFAVPEARSFSSSVAYGAISGIAGGAGHAEANAIFRQGKAFASSPELISDTANFAAFGAAFGALGYGVEKLSSSLQGRTQTSKSDTGKVEVNFDRQGNPVLVKTVTPSVNANSDYQIKVVNTKMTNGEWQASSGAKHPGDWSYWMDAQDYNVQQVNRLADGTIKVLDNNGEVRSFSPGAAYERYPVNAKLQAGENFQYTDSSGNVTKINGAQLAHTDYLGRLTRFQDMDTKALDLIGHDPRTGEVDLFTAWKKGSPEISFTSHGSGKWGVSLSDVGIFDSFGIESRTTSAANMIDWTGEIKPAGTPGRFMITPEGAKPFEFNVGDSTTHLQRLIYNR